jgi:DNA polymerase III epsilon subunit-like protein
VPDAAAPDPELPLVDLQRGDPAPEVTEHDVVAARDALCVQAADAAAAHLERSAGRAARQARSGRVAATALQRDLETARYCVIDTETTGARPGLGDELLEIGAVRVVGGELDLEFSSLVRPLGPITAGAHAVHGISAQDAATAPPVEEILPYVAEMGRDCVLVFHNAPFDLSFLQRALADAGRPVFEAPVIDTLVVARRLLGGRCGLGMLGERLGLEGPHLHRALPDARLTARLLIRLLAFLCDAGAERLEHVPGIAIRPARQRRRRGPASQRVAAAPRTGLVERRGRCDWPVMRGAGSHRSHSESASSTSRRTSASCTTSIRAPRARSIRRASWPSNRRPEAASHPVPLSGGAAVVFNERNDATMGS